MKRSFFAALAAALFAGCASQPAAQVTLGTLLDEMTSFRETALWPAIPYVCAQESSHDRRSVDPDTPEWFANDDGFGFIRTDTIDGRQEKVLFDERGPGAITRIWLTTQHPGGTLRFYFDDTPLPGWVVPAYDLMRFGLSVPGRGMLYPHTSYEAGVRGGSTLYLPIPYARACRITFEEPAGAGAVPHYYHVNFRRYPEGTRVESFSVSAVEKHRRQLARADRLLLDPDRALPRGRTDSQQRTLAPGDTLSLVLPAGSRCVYRTELLVECDSTDYEQIMRQLIFCASFDGIRTVWVPVGDFSGGGMGAPFVESRYLSADGRGRVVSRWPMPYRSTGEISICNLSELPCRITLRIRSRRRRWSDRTLYFHAAWKQERGLDIHKRWEESCDWNFAFLDGRGIYRGDALSLFNRSRAWYGEGDEKIWVDGESFPSHFGTGVEDYYNSSWAPVRPFHTPFGGAPRADLKSSHGYNAWFRTRSLDAIPFRDSLRFDMEMTGWTDGKVDYATTVYWYGDAGSAARNTSGAEEACRPLPQRPADPASFRIEGAVEFENLVCSRKSDRLGTDRQEMDGFPEGLWSGGSQFVAFGGERGDFVEFEWHDLQPGRYRAELYLTQAADYGTVALQANRAPAVAFDSYRDVVTQHGPVVLKHIAVSDGTLRLRIEITGRNPRSSGTMFGLDCMVLRPEDSKLPNTPQP